MGSTVALTNASAAVIRNYKLDPWGNIRNPVPISGSPQTVNRHIFTGKELDANTGLYYYGARYYDPEIGRFLTQDPYLGQANNPPSLNRYMYAHANPTVFVDPTGYAAEEEKGFFRKLVDKAEAGFETVAEGVEDFMRAIDPVVALRRSAGMDSDTVNWDKERREAEYRRTGDIVRDVGEIALEVPHAAEDLYDNGASIGNVATLGIAALGVAIPAARGLNKLRKARRAAGVFEAADAIEDTVRRASNTNIARTASRVTAEASSGSRTFAQVSPAKFGKKPFEGIRTKIRENVGRFKRDWSETGYSWGDKMDSFVSGKRAMASMSEESASIVTRSGTYPRVVTWFDESEVMLNMKSSRIGRIVAEAAENHRFRLEFSKSPYKEGMLAEENFNILGMAFHKKAKVYLPAHRSNASVASSAVHEGVHMLGVRGSQRSEVLARVSEMIHAGQEPSLADLTRIYRFVRRVKVDDKLVYGNLRQKVGKTSELFPGVEF